MSTIHLRFVLGGQCLTIVQSLEGITNQPLKLKLFKAQLNAISVTNRSKTKPKKPAIIIILETNGIPILRSIVIFEAQLATFAISKVKIYPHYFSQSLRIWLSSPLPAQGKFKDKKLKILAQNMERNVSFSVGDLRFIDSFQFMTSSLETLVNNLASEGLSHFRNFTNVFKNQNIEKCY